MQHRPWLKRSYISAVVSASLGLTACGGGGPSTSAATETGSTTTTLSGIVADGYLVNATVCLDLNLSKTCDSGEPTATSTSGGNYSLDATQKQIDTYPIVAEIVAGTTVDEDNPGAPVARAYTLSAPAGKGAFVSPLSTLVQSQIEITGKTATQIENEILTSMGQDPTLISLFDDYIANKADATNPPTVQDSYLQLHQIAQVTATTIANNIEVIESAISAGEISLDLATTLDSVITIIVQNVIAELTLISSEIDTAASFDANVIATAVNVTIDTTTIEDQVAVAEAATNAAVTSNVESVFTTGIGWLWAEFSDWNNEMERSTITYDAVTGKLSEPIERYFASTTPGWTLSPASDDVSVLQTNGSWLPANDSWDGASVSFDNSTGTATIAGNRGKEAITNIKVSALAGLSIKQFVAKKLPHLSQFIDPTAKFTYGSSSYSLRFTSLEESYSIWNWGDCGPSVQNVNGNCNTIVDWSTGSGIAVTSLTDLPSQTAWVNPGDSSSYPKVQGLGSIDTSSTSTAPYQSMYYELVKGAGSTSGTVNYYLYTFGSSAPEITKVGTGVWAITIVKGTELLMVNHPDELMSQYSHVATDLDSPEENHFYAIQDSVVRQGDHWPANISDDSAESLLTNKQAQDEITNAFLSTTIVSTTPTAELACNTNSEWNPLIDEPLASYSFAAFEAVVTACGGAAPINATILADDGNGVSRTHSLSDGIMITFNLDNTGSYTENGNPASSFDWTIDSTSNLITLVNPDGSSRDILAVIAVDSITVPSKLSFKGYIEEIGRSDMITDQGSDGQIVDLAAY